MLRFSRKVEYAIIALLHIESQQNAELVTARELSGRYRIPAELMGKILQNLARAGMVQSVQGANGGYRIRKSPDQININQIVEVVDRPIKIVNCIEHDSNCGCEQLKFCIIKDTMNVIQGKLERFFDTITLKDLKDEIQLESYNLNVKV